jgi:glycosyltransferase involved in cell wall biosynthesis
MSEPAERPKIATEPLTVLLPAYNQAAGLEAIGGSWLRELDRLGRPYELVVIDDGSTDETGAVADRLAARWPRARVVRHDKRQGFGACLRTGLAAGGHPLLFYTACDYPYPPADLRKLLEAIDAVDIAAGVRTDPMPGWMRAVGRVYRLLVRVIVGVPLEPRPGWRGWAEWRRDAWLRWVFGLRLPDVSCAFKLFRRSVFDRLPVQSDGDFVHAEILAKANFMECILMPVPIGRLGGHFKGVPEPPPPGVSYAAEVLLVLRRPRFQPPNAVENATAGVGKGIPEEGEKGGETPPLPPT